MKHTDLDLAALMNDLIPLIREAGRVVMGVYQTDFGVETKGDESPVTAADRLAEEVILAGLSRLTPQIPVIAEEAVSGGHVPDVGACFWVVDPVDGTKEFISRNGEFTVNIALVGDRRPVLGLVLAPALDQLFYGAEGAGAWMADARGTRAIRVRAVPPEGLTVVGSRRHGDDAAESALLAGRLVAERRSVGSSLKLCLVAEGGADVYPRFGRTMEWDIAAGDAVLRAAGGAVNTLEGNALGYGKPGFENPHFVAWGQST